MKIQNNLAENTLKLLKAYMASHAVFNALTYVQNHIADDEKRASLKALSNFANFIRTSTDDIDLVLRPQQKELLMLNSYIMLETWRFGERLQITNNLIASSKNIPSFFYAPFVEQLILIGLASNSENLQIELKSYEENGIEAQCNFTIPAAFYDTFNEEQNNRRQLFLKRIDYYETTCNIQAKFNLNEATLSFEKLIK